MALKVWHFSSLGQIGIIPCKGVVDVTQQAEFEVLLYPHPSLIILKTLF